MITLRAQRHEETLRTAPNGSCAVSIAPAEWLILHAHLWESHHAGPATASVFTNQIFVNAGKRGAGRRESEWYA